jgi:cell division septation protein DedD
MSATVVDMRTASAEVEARHPAPSLPSHPAGRQLAPMTPEPEPPAGTRAARRARVSPRLWSLMLVAGLPTIAAALYFLFVAADQYVAEFRFGLRAS